VLFNSLTFVVFFTVVLALHYAPLSWKHEEGEPARRELSVLRGLESPVRHPPVGLDGRRLERGQADLHAAEDIAKRRRPPGSPSASLDEPRPARLLQVRRVPARELAEPDVERRGSTGRRPEWSIVLPVGISFYTFQTMAYSLDVYLRRAEPAGLASRLRPVRDVLPATRGRADRPAHRSSSRSSDAPPVRANPDQLGWGLGLMVAGAVREES
jgi:alginate O-acetyltransferase complex protein AlgI